MAVSNAQLQEKREREEYEKGLAILEAQRKKTDSGVTVEKGGTRAVGKAWLAGWQPRGNPGEWPVEQLNRLQKSYGDDSSLGMLLGERPGKAKGIGWGPQLLALADSMGHNVPMFRGTFKRDPELLTKQFGFRSPMESQVVATSQGGQITKAALAENSGTTGGYTVPPQFMNELLTIAAEDAFIEPRCKILPMTTRTAWWPMLDITTAQTLGVTPYFGGVVAAWQPEAALINETEPAFKQTEWTAWDLVLYSVVSNQLLADNGIGLDALLTQLFAQAMTWYKEFAFLQGRGAGNSMPLGVLNAPATYTYTRNTVGAFKLPDVAGMMSHLQIRSWDTACWIMHQSVLPQLIQMHDYTGSSNVGNHLVWLTPFGDDKQGPFAMKMPNAFFNGLPLYFTEKLPVLGSKGDVMLVDWSRYVVGQRLDFQIDVSPHYLKTDDAAFATAA